MRVACSFSKFWRPKWQQQQQGETRFADTSNLVRSKRAHFGPPLVVELVQRVVQPSVYVGLHRHAGGSHA